MTGHPTSIPSVLFILAFLCAPASARAQFTRTVSHEGVVCPKPKPPQDSIIPSDPHAPAETAPELHSPKAKALLRGLEGHKGAETHLSFAVDIDGTVDRCTIRIIYESDSIFTNAVIARLVTSRWLPARFDGAVVKMQINQSFAVN